MNADTHDAQCRLGRAAPPSGADNAGLDTLDRYAAELAEFWGLHSPPAADAQPRAA